MRASKIIYTGLAVGELASFAVVYWWIDAIGILIGIAVAAVAIVVIPHEASRAKIAYAHGYHAGYHAGADIECFGPDCELISMSLGRVEEISALASAVGESDPFPVGRR